MTTETIPTYKRWREDLDKWMRQGEALEAIAAQHPEIPFMVEPTKNMLEWDEHGENIQAFSDRVRKVAAIFGAATTVKTTHANADKAPDMEAIWRLDDDRRVRLWSLWPQCRIHPESHYLATTSTKGEAAAIHPECADVLKELEDYEPTMENER